MSSLCETRDSAGTCSARRLEALNAVRPQPVVGQGLEPTRNGRGVAHDRTIPIGHTRQMNVAPIKPPITLKLLDQIDVRVGTIESVGDVPGSERLMALRVHFGDHTRTIIAGLKQERTNPREIEGRQALFVVNLPPRTLAGVVSEGMLFDIGYADGITPVLAVPESNVPAGARAG